MNVTLRAQKSATDSLDVMNLRCDTDGRLLPGRVGFVDVRAVATTAPAYTAGDCVGGELAVTPPAGVNAMAGDTFVLDSLSIVDHSNLAPELRVLFFSMGPTSDGGLAQDNAAYSWSSGTDGDLMLGKLDILTSDWVTIASKKVATVNNLGLALKLGTAGKIYAVLVAIGAPNLGTSGFNMTMGFRRL